jgi:hypothetical protein
MSLALIDTEKNLTPTSDVLLVSSEHNQYQIKQFTAQRFNDVYRARVNDFLPNMLALVDNQHCLQASAGFQSAEGAHLYLEHYLKHSLNNDLDGTIEAAIAARLGIQAPKRAEILEVGNLASISPGATRRFILNLACHFQSQGYKWLVMTATPQIKNSFDKLNISSNLHSICSARSNAIKATQSDWGSYYDHVPEVYVVDINSGITALKCNPLFHKLLSRIKSPAHDTGVLISGDINGREITQ